MSAIVADLVVQAASAGAEAVAQHFENLLNGNSFHLVPEAVAQALDLGYDADLDERTTAQQVVGYDHLGATRIFRRRLRAILHNTSMSHHIWEADEDQGLYSLFGVPPRGEAAFRVPRRTRASVLVQRQLRDCRGYRQAGKASKGSGPGRMVTVPSPLFVAKQLLGDPRSIASQTYAAAALQEWAREEIEDAVRGPIDLSFAGISEALTVINNRWKTSKPIAADLRNNGATVVFLCNLLAIHGAAAMRVDMAYLLEALELRQEPHGDDLDAPAAESDFASLDANMAMDLRLRDLWLGASDVPCEFVINPQYAELPSAGAVLNLIDSLPMPFEGGETVFQGGIRLSADKSVVAAISGEFGTGKTLFGLSLAAALAPLGCRTLFLSCEESAADLQSRLMEAAPRSLFRSLPLFKALKETDFNLRSLEEQMATGGDASAGLPWFAARQLIVQESAFGEEQVDPASGLAELLRDAVANAKIFDPWGPAATAVLPSFARPVVIIDGLHQLFDLPDIYDVYESSLRKLVETCRSLGAIFLFSFSSEAKELKRLEYLCDLIIEVERGGHASPSQKPSRMFQLLKARRQPARTGAHVFHIKGDAGFRIKPSVDARVQELKTQLWWATPDHGEIFLTDDPPPGFKEDRVAARHPNAMSINNHGQVLVIGQGSSGKAGFGLYLLHRRWFDPAMIIDQRQLSLPIDRRPTRPEDLPLRQRAILDGRLPVRSDAPYLETRVLVISFLYQKDYYDELTARLALKRRGKADRSFSNYQQLDELSPFEYAPLPDRMRTDTIELYPGMLSVEDFIAKVEKRLAAAERSGLPYTGVLVDGLHNVFVQFPALEKESSFWGMFYNILRRRRVSVVTTHTEFDINAHPGAQDAVERDTGAMAYDFEQAQRKIAPLLSALVSGADYLFDLSPSHEAGSLVYRLTPRAALGGDVSGLSYVWDKERMRLEHQAPAPARGPVGGDADRRALTRALGDQLLTILDATVQGLPARLAPPAARAPRTRSS